ncbi:lipopolysaccharide biosynthesis protein [Cellulomonas soli]
MSGLDPTPRVVDEVPVPAVATEADGAPAADGHDDIGRRAASGVLWMTAQKWLMRFSGLATVAILTRLLGPEQFGLVAAASTVAPIVYLFSDLGFSAYIVQADEVDERRLSTGFWFSTVVGGLMCVGLLLFAPVLADLFHLPDLVPVLRVMTISIAFVVVTSIPYALLRRRMQFRALAVQGAIAALLAQVVAVVTALAGMGVWALVLQLIVAQGVSAVLAWIWARWRPRLLFSTHEFVAMARFGLQVVGVDVIAMLRSWAETAIVVASLGATGLGYLSIAQKLIQVTQDMSAAALLPVSTVVFAQVRTSADRLREAYLKALGVSYAAVAPVMTVVAVTGPVLVPLMFGDGWGPSVQVAQALAVAAILTLGAMLDHGLFYGVGKPGRWLVYAVAIDVLTVATTAWAVQWGLRGMALGFIGVAVVATAVRWVLVGRLVDAPARTVARPFGGVAVCVALSALAGAAAARVTSGLPAIVELGITGLVIGVVHVVAVRFLMPSTARAVVEMLPGRVRGPLLRVTGWAPAREEENV